MGKVIVQVWESNFVLCPDWLPDDNFVDVVKLIPVLIPQIRQKEIVTQAIGRDRQTFLTKDAASVPFLLLILHSKNHCPKQQAHHNAKKSKCSELTNPTKGSVTLVIFSQITAYLYSEI